METTEEILALGNAANETHSALESLLWSKLKDLGIADPEETEDPRVTDVERNFLYVSEQERGFMMSGNLYQYLDDIAPHASRWGAVGMPETESVIKVMQKVAMLEELIFTKISDEELAAQLDDAINDLRKKIEHLAVPDGEFERRLSEYVARNIDQFCRQDSKGNFV